MLVSVSLLGAAQRKYLENNSKSASVSYRLILKKRNGVGGGKDL